MIPLCAVVACGPGTGRCEKATRGGSFCVPDAGVAPAGQALTLEIADCGGCGTSSLSCTVARDGGSIVLTLEGQQCEPPPGTACLAVCRIDRYSCAVPALPEGDYTVSAPNSGSQTLQVRDAGAASCVAGL
jgi:hypothetical protein